MKRSIVNLTQHASTLDQQREGVFDLTDTEELKELRRLIIFDSLPTKEEIDARALDIATLAARALKDRDGEKTAMIGGAPYLMSYLEYYLRRLGITVLYAFSKRISVDREVDGRIEKHSVFVHEGFIEA